MFRNTVVCDHHLPEKAVGRAFNYRGEATRWTVTQFAGGRLDLAIGKHRSTHRGNLANMPESKLLKLVMDRRL